MGGDARSDLDRSRAGRGAPPGDMGHRVRPTPERIRLLGRRRPACRRRRALERRGSPGYLVSSGDALLRLYRATGDVALLELLRQTIHNLAQYLPPAGGTPAVPAGDRPDGDCPRTATARWLDPGGGVVPVDGAFD